MSITSLILMVIFIIIPIVISKSLKLGLEKDTVIAGIRSFIQLLIVGYILQFIFDKDNPIFMILMVVLIIGAATQNARKKGLSIPGITWKLLLAYVSIELITQGILIGLKIIPPTPQYVIPITGMVIGNAMVLSILFLNRFISEIQQNENLVKLILSLGGTPKQAIHKQLMTSIQTSAIPTIEQQKTIGLVQLPGMMSGQIIAGADPIDAVFFQILIVFILITSAVTTSVILGFLSYPTLFNSKKQLIESRFE
ncbi:MULTISPECIES: ABC transporter permease [Mammaliicoccus]|jgi:putative ABC transport system permease protein|uniref:Iron export ABC transporter permease subunit FetB n=1 Tax=Mammaliicoccus lentus TaxID=42858 RepID=A0AAX3W2V2_MAMLE|nr:MULTISPECIES: iron export ABC transporter permease subunit FetB [Mammaliicoccus]HIS17371.1 iron export ABC transporter permease subunit FetB [Candidatus Coprovivens excrementavium]MBF0749474.1 iron export ABC transporter permease subunit FetB [Mammaliicoccus lentus]MBU6113744.1 iron export ABC transporter permease subunit FetB [Mammaliicoccus lentus]MBW0763077.1 iron export ABC transporter permease subunit FetB [Mammaliicoccus lentus]MBW0768065.1 iron export ABC transporter permease subunit